MDTDAIPDTLLFVDLCHYRLTGSTLLVILNDVLKFVSGVSMLL